MSEDDCLVVRTVSEVSCPRRAGGDKDAADASVATRKGEGGKKMASS